MVRRPTGTYARLAGLCFGLAALTAAPVEAADPPPVSEAAALSGSGTPPAPSAAQAASPHAKAAKTAKPAKSAPKKQEEAAKPVMPAPVAAAPVAAPVPAAAASTAQEQAAAKPQAAAPAEITIKVTPLVPTNLAVFRRNGSLWLVFDQPMNALAAEIGGERKSHLQPPRRVALERGTAFQFEAPDGLAPVVTHSGLSWTIGLTPSAPTPKLPELSVAQVSGKAQLELAMGKGAGVVSLPDPDTGDTLLVVPTPAETGGFDEYRQYAELEILPAVQGLVVRPISDQVAIAPTAEAIAIETPSGLKLSSAQAERSATLPTGAAIGNEKPDRIFDFQSWLGPNKRQLQLRRREMEIAAATKTEALDRVPIYLDLARLHFAYGYAQEMLGYLALALQMEPGLEASPEFRMLRGAGSALAGNVDAARDDLGLPPLTDQSDITLFRGLALARAERWRDAHPAFHAGIPLLGAYPDGLFRPLALAALETAVQTDDVGMAKLLLEKVEDRAALRPLLAAAIDFYRGQVLAAEGDAQGAAVLWRATAARNDQYFRTRAELALVEQGMAQNTLSPKEAVERLERLRLAWRGDEIEIRVLRLLGQQRIANNDPEEGLNALRLASTILGDGAAGDEVRKQMTKVFDDLFDGGGVDRLSPLRGLALFQDYKDLAPTIASQDRVIDHLADRMVQMDLLDQAADLLTKQAAMHAEPLEKGRMGARVAAIRLLDSKPDLALGALDRSESDKLPHELKFERKLLRARALFKTGKSDEALALLKDDNSVAADELRVDIAWQARRWKLASDVLARLAGPPPAEGKLDDVRARLVLNRAVALALAEDAAGLQLVRNQFGASMRDTPDGELFAVLTRSTSEGGLSIEAIRAQVAEIDMFKGFLANYRTRAGGGA